VTIAHINIKHISYTSKSNSKNKQKRKAHNTVQVTIMLKHCSQNIWKKIPIKKGVLEHIRFEEIGICIHSFFENLVLWRCYL